MNEVKTLTKSQRGYLWAIRQKHNAAFEAEINQAVNGVIEELGFSEELKSGKVQVQLANDYSAMTIVQAPPAAPQPKPRIPGKLKK